jgi:hypothetical protein
MVEFGKEKIKENHWERFDFNVAGYSDFLTGWPTDKIMDQYMQCHWEMEKQKQYIFGLFEPDVRPYQNWKFSSNLHTQEPGFVHPIHNEVENKLLSVVTYLHPESSVGTILYNDDQSNPFEVEWAPNRAMIFSPGTGNKWHSFAATDDAPRVTFNGFYGRLD